jgi:hypothetical protein
MVVLSLNWLRSVEGGFTSGLGNEQIGPLAC